MAGPLLLQNNLLYHIRSCSREWLEFTLLLHCQSRCQRISFLALSKTLSCFILLLCILTGQYILDRPGGSKMPILFFPLGLKHHWVKVQTLGQMIAFIHCLVLSTMALFAFYGGQCCVQKYFWLCLGKRRRKAASDGTLDLRCDIVPLVPGMPWESPIFRFKSGKVPKT